MTSFSIEWKTKTKTLQQNTLSDKVVELKEKAKSFPDKQKLEDFTAIKLSSHKKSKFLCFKQNKDTLKIYKITKTTNFVIIVFDH